MKWKYINQTGAYRCCAQKILQNEKRIAQLFAKHDKNNYSRIMAGIKKYNWKKVLAQLILLALPTALLGFYLLQNVNSFYAIMQNKWLLQGAYFAAGMGIAITFYAYRFRFLPTAALLIIAYFIINYIINKTVIGEFDTFFAIVQFRIFSILFFTGWLAGYGFSRSKIFYNFFGRCSCCAFR